LFSAATRNTSDAWKPVMRWLQPESSQVVQVNPYCK